MRKRFQPRYNWRQELSSLRANPGEWAHITPEDDEPVTVAAAQQLAQRIRTGRNLGVNIIPGDYEAMTRKNALWVRYLGGN